MQEIPPEDPEPRVQPLALVIIGVLLVSLAILGIWLLASRNDSKPDTVRSELQTKTWRIASSKASVPRTEVSAALYEQKAYIVGGFDQAGKPTNTVEVFDPATETWAAGPALPIPVHHTSAVVFDDKLYVIGGLTGSDFKATNKVCIYDGAEWKEGPLLPEAIGAAGATVLEDRLYLVGGTDIHGQNSNRIYSIGKGEKIWKEESAMLTARNHLGVAAASGQLYAIAGRNETSMTLRAVEVYDPTTKTWTATADLPTGRSGVTAATLNDKIYVFGGETTEITFGETEEYDPATQTWRELPPMPEPRHGLGSVVFNNRVFLFLGGPLPNLTVSDDVQILE